MEHREAVELPDDLPVHVQQESLVRFVLWDRGGGSSGNSRGEGNPGVDQTRVGEGPHGDVHDHPRDVRHLLLQDGDPVAQPADLLSSSTVAAILMMNIESEQERKRK